MEGIIVSENTWIAGIGCSRARDVAEPVPSNESNSDVGMLHVANEMIHTII
jgi:hypothetical protein